MSRTVGSLATRNIPSPLERAVMPAAKAKAIRPAVTPQLRPQDKSESARGVVRPVTRAGRNAF
jgi:hypothetical protein